MKKLTMKVEDLRIESFNVQTAKTESRGTVRAHAGNSDLCFTPGCGGTDPWDTLGCSFTADFECMDTINCP